MFSILDKELEPVAQMYALALAVFFATRPTHVSCRCFALEAMLDSYLPNILDKEARLHKVAGCAFGFRSLSPAGAGRAQHAAIKPFA